MPASSVEENTEVQISPIEIVQIVDTESGHFQVAFRTGQAAIPWPPKKFWALVRPTNE